MKKDFASIEDAMDFVESFRPWELHGVQDVTVERKAGLVSEPESIGEPDSRVADAEPDSPVADAEPAALDRQSPKRWWEFWKRD